MPESDDKKIYQSFLVSRQEDSERYAHTINFFSWFLNDDGTIKNPRYKPCQRVGEILRHLRIINRSRAFSNLSEATQMQMYQDSD